MTEALERADACFRCAQTLYQIADDYESEGNTEKAKESRDKAAGYVQSGNVAMESHMAQVERLAREAA